MAITLSGNNTNVGFTTTSATIVAEPSGNTIIMWIASQRSPAARVVSSISTTNVTWAKLGGTTNGVMDAEIWWGKVSGGSSGTAVTITMSGTGSTIAGRITGFTGLTATPSLDATPSIATGTSVTPATAAYSASVSGGLSLTIAGYANGTTPTGNPGSPWTNITFNNNSTTVGVAGGYNLSDTAGALSASWTITSAVWSTTIGAILPPSSAFTKTQNATALVNKASTVKTPVNAKASSLRVNAGSVVRSPQATRTGNTALPATAGYAYQATVTIPAATNSTQSNFTVLIQGTRNELKTVANGGQVQHTVTRTGMTVPADLVVSTDSGFTSLCKWGWEFYDAVNGIIMLRVLLPSWTTGSSITLYISVGNANVTTWQGGAQGSEFDTNTAAYWPMPDGTTLSMKDFGPNSLDGTGHATPTAQAGRINGGSIGLAAASSQFVSIDSNPSALQINPFTWECWFRLSSTIPGSTVWCLMGKDDEAGTRGPVMYVFDAGGGALLSGDTFTTNAPTTDNLCSDSTVLSASTWYYASMRFDVGTSNIFISLNNGATSGGQTCGANTQNNPAANLDIGARTNGAGFQDYIDARMASVKVSSQTRSVDWLLNSYNNQLSPPVVGTFAALGTVAATPFTGATQVRSTGRTTLSFMGSNLFLVWSTLNAVEWGLITSTLWGQISQYGIAGYTWAGSVVSTFIAGGGGGGHTLSVNASMLRGTASGIRLLTKSQAALLNALAGSAIRLPARNAGATAIVQAGSGVKTPARNTAATALASAAKNVRTPAHNTSAATSAAAATGVRAPSHNTSATAPAAGASQQRVDSRAGTASMLADTASTIKSRGRIQAALSVADQASRLQAFTRNLTATDVASGATRQASFVRSLAASVVASAASAVKVGSRALVASCRAVAGSGIKLVSQPMAASTAVVTGSTVKGIARIATASATGAKASVTKLVSRACTAVVAAFAAIVTSGKNSSNFVLTQSAVLMNATALRLQAAARSGTGTAVQAAVSAVRSSIRSVTAAGSTFAGAVSHGAIRTVIGAAAKAGAAFTAAKSGFIFIASATMIAVRASRIQAVGRTTVSATVQGAATSGRVYARVTGAIAAAWSASGVRTVSRSAAGIARAASATLTAVKSASGFAFTATASMVAAATSRVQAIARSSAAVPAGSTAAAGRNLVRTASGVVSGAGAGISRTVSRLLSATGMVATAKNTVLHGCSVAAVSVTAHAVRLQAAGRSVVAASQGASAAFSRALVRSLAAFGAAAGGTVSKLMSRSSAATGTSYSGVFTAVKNAVQFAFTILAATATARATTVSIRSTVQFFSVVARTATGRASVSRGVGRSVGAILRRLAGMWQRGALFSETTHKAVPFTPTSSAVPANAAFSAVPANSRVSEAFGMRMVSFEKYAEETEFFGLDWVQRGVSVTDPLVSSVWEVPIELTSAQETFTITTTQILLGSGDPGSSYRIKNTVTTQSGQTKSCEILLKVS